MFCKGSYKALNLRIHPSTRRDEKVFECFALLSLEPPREKLGNRSRVDILATILDVAHNGALKTHIMYKANLSHRQLEKYLAYLIDQGMVVKTRDELYNRTVYQVADKGIEFLKDYSRLSAHLNSIEI
jgi:predicted transcriptional regulator